MSVDDITWILFGAEDARRFLTDRKGPAHIRALDPVALAALRGATDVSVERERFSDWAQGRTTVAVARAAEKLVEAVRTWPDDRAIHREVALELFRRAAYASYRLWFALGPQGPWRIRSESGWSTHTDRVGAHGALLAHMLAPFAASHGQSVQGLPLPFPALYRALRHLFLRAAFTGGPCVACGARKGMFDLLDQFVAAAPNARVLIVRGAAGGWSEYPRLVREAWRAVRGLRFLDVGLAVEATPPDRLRADALIAAVGDPIIERALRHYRDLLGRRLSEATAAARDAGHVVEAARPSHLVSPDMSRMSEWAMAEACGASGATRWVMSRNTHVPNTSRLARDGCEGYFLARHPEGMVDRFVFWTPHGATAARAFLPASKWGAIEAVAAVPVSRSSAPISKPQRQVLLADSYAAYWFPHCWAFQTSQEFLESLDALRRTLEALPDTTLLVRAKAKRELDMAQYEALVPRSDRLTIKIRDVPFRRDLEDSDVLVAFRATTIEEALHARRAVLLWGGSARFRYLPARTAPPRPDDRSAIYAAMDERHLKTLLPAILDAHAGRPLTDAEIAPHVWPTGTPGIRDLAVRMARSDTTNRAGQRVPESLRA